MAKKQKDTKWRPNPKQIKLAELLLNPEDRRTKTEKMKEADVSRKTFYRWMKDPRYIDYLNSQLEQYTNGELVDIWRALINQAKRGSFQHIKLFFELKGQYVEKKEVNATIKQENPFAGLTTEELRQLIADED